MTTLPELLKELRSYADPIRAEHALGFFKTGKGEYGEGDQFIGVTVPKVRVVAKKASRLEAKELIPTFLDPIHEVRLMGFLALVYAYQRAKERTIKDEIIELLLTYKKGINNWDLVDTVIPKTLGFHCRDGYAPASLLHTYAKSTDLWEKRIAMMATFPFIDQGSFDLTLEFAKRYLGDTHDLIHKVSGWALREVGKKDLSVLRAFLDKHTLKMPRTMLRYAIEKLPEPERKAYLLKK